ncbi:MAG: AAA family ATPase [Clostridia bacterium]|nr:AAA family ATPase [Clostridia bacterium]
MDMKIISLNITEFGGLSDFSLDLSGGLNIIRGDNESGKSTVLLFVMYMLYGLPKSARKGTPGAYDKDRSISRRSGKAQGSMEIECDGRRFRIERSNLRRGRNSEVTVTDLDTGESLFAGREPGEAILGVSRETFESCLWCAQSRSFVISSEGVRDTLANLSLTADESVNGDRVLRQIREEKKRYKYEKGQGGLIFEADIKVRTARERIAMIDAAMVRAERHRDEAERTEAELALAEERLKKADALRRAESRLATLDRFDSLAKVRAEIAELRARADALAEKYPIARFSPSAETLYTLKNLRTALAKRCEDLEYARAGARPESKLDAAAIELADKIADSEGEAGFISRVKGAFENAKKQRIGAVAFLVSAVMLCVGGALVTPIGFAVGGALAVLSVLCFIKGANATKKLVSELSALGVDKENYESVIRYAFAQKKIYAAERELCRAAEEREASAMRLFREAEAELCEFFSGFGLEYSPATADAFSREVATYLTEGEAITRALSVKEGLEAEHSRALARYDEAELRRDMPSEEERERLKFINAEDEYRRATLEYNELQTRLAGLRIRIATEGFDADARADAVAQLETAKAERAVYRERFDALSLAFDAVAEAYDNMRRNFAPKIRERAGAYLSDISEGRYKKVMLAEDMSISIEDIGEEVSVGTLSSGTADAVYMALRMALIEKIFEGDVPLFLDESLSQLDDGRAKNMLRMIDKFVCGGSQCLLFSCHSREERLCRELGIEFSKIEMPSRKR